MNPILHIISFNSLIVTGTINFHKKKLYCIRCNHYTNWNIVVGSPLWSIRCTYIYTHIYMTIYPGAKIGAKFSPKEKRKKSEVKGEEKRRKTRSRIHSYVRSFVRFHFNCYHRNRYYHWSRSNSPSSWDANCTIRALSLARDWRFPSTYYHYYHWTAIPSPDTFDRAVCNRQSRTVRRSCRWGRTRSNGGWSSGTWRRWAPCCGGTGDGDNFPGGCDACERSGSDNNRRLCTGSGRHCKSARRNIGSGSPSPVTLNSKWNHTRRDEFGSSVGGKKTAVTG